MNLRLLTAATLVLASTACQGKVDLAGDEPELLTTPAETEATTEQETTTPTTPVTQETDPTSEEPEVVVEIPDFTPAQLVEYMRSISQMVVSRPMTPAEATQIEQGGMEAVETILRDWTTQPAFAENARFMVQRELKASGDRGEIDFELPGNLVAHIVNSDLPWSNILTADYCVDASGAEMPCDTGAPYSAGVLATRAYLAGNASRFNLGRANRLMEVFACRIYPMENTLQPYLERETLIPMFRADTAEEQEVEAAKNGFGNGDGCYACHGQFGAHAQLFVKFTEDGLYVPDATGLQDPDGELGRSVNGLMTSHMVEPSVAASEQSQVFGQQVANLGEAAAVIADSPAFLPCQLGNFLHFVFGLPESVAVDPRMLRSLAARIDQEYADPTLAELAIESLTEPAVILGAVGTAEAGAEGGAP